MSEWKYVKRDGNPTDRSIYLVVKRDGGFRIGIFYAGAWHNLGMPIEDVYAYRLLEPAPPLEPEGTNQTSRNQKKAWSRAYAWRERVIEEPPPLEPEGEES